MSTQLPSIKAKLVGLSSDGRYVGMTITAIAGQPIAPEDQVTVAHMMDEPGSWRVGVLAKDNTGFYLADVVQHELESEAWASAVERSLAEVAQRCRLGRAPLEQGRLDIDRDTGEVREPRSRAQKIADVAVDAGEDAGLRVTRDSRGVATVVIGEGDTDKLVEAARQRRTQGRQGGGRVEVTFSGQEAAVLESAARYLETGDMEPDEDGDEE